MNESLIPLFEGHDIRVWSRTENSGSRLKISASAWGVDRKTPANLIGRNKDLFEGMFRSDGDVTYHDVNEKGLYPTHGKDQCGPAKNPKARDAMIRFQRWVPELIQKYRKHEIAQVPAAPDIRTELQEARELAMICGKSPESFQAVILRKHGKSELAAELKASGEIVRGETGWYTVTGLVELCDDPILTAERLNTYLANCRENGEWKPFQYKEGKIWRLAPRGLPHGKEYPFNLGNGHSEPRISWRESILVAAGLKRPVSGDQMALPARAV